MDLFFASYTTSGTLNWVQSIGNGTLLHQTLGLAVDSSSLYLAADFTGAIDVDPSDSALEVVSDAVRTIFVAKYSKDTGQLVPDFVHGRSLQRDR